MSLLWSGILWETRYCRKIGGTGIRTYRNVQKETITPAAFVLRQEHLVGLYYADDRLKSEWYIS